MTRFLKWRKMTWALIAWNAAMSAWVVGIVAAGTGTSGCSVDSTGAAASSLTRQDCLDSAARGFGIPLVALLWGFGLALLIVVWFSTRPLWRQGHGARLRRLRADEFLAGSGPRDRSTSG